MAARYAAATSRWRPGRSRLATRLNASKNRWAEPGDLNRRITRSRIQVGWCTGATREIPVANPPAPDVHVMTLHVATMETLRTATGPVPCFAVVAPTGATMWLARDDGHVARMRWTLPDGSTVWKLPLRDAPLR